MRSFGTRTEIVRKAINERDEALKRLESHDINKTDSAILAGLHDEIRSRDIKIAEYETMIKRLEAENARMKEAMRENEGSDDSETLKQLRNNIESFSAELTKLKADKEENLRRIKRVK